jgi:hypothetical protein
MRCSALMVLAGFALSGCGQVSEIAAMGACMEKLETIFPEAKGLSDDDIGDVEGLGSADSDGSFSFTVAYNDGSPAWSCRGNHKSHQIDELSFEGTVKQPTDEEYWSY